MGRWAQRQRSGTDKTPGLAANVVSVQKITGNHLLWTFNVQIVSDSIASPQLLDATLGANAQPIGTTQSGLYAVDCLYNATPAIGHTWQINSTPTHLTNPNGSGFVVPRTATVT